jgi:hypothetical protein
MSEKKRISKSLATINWQTQSLSLSIRNEDGVHTHERNGEKFQGKQMECPLCANGSEFERKMGAIGV